MPPKKDTKKAEQVVQQPVQPPPPQQGYSTFQYLNGAIYQGNWKVFNGIKCKHGYGKLTVTPKWSQLKQYYQGNWNQDKMQGFGQYYYISGAQYKGQWKDNKHNGIGVYKFPNGMIYDGQWQNHLMNGSGSFYIQGTKWQGQFRQGKYYTTIQKQLVKQKQLQNRKNILERSVNNFLDKMISQFNVNNEKAGEEQKNKKNKLFVSKDLIQTKVKLYYIGYQSFQEQKWKMILQKLKDGQKRVLTNAAQSQIINPLCILNQQLSGSGQIVQIINEKDQNLKIRGSMVMIEDDLWGIVCIKQIN